MAIPYDRFHPFAARNLGYGSCVDARNRRRLAFARIRLTPGVWVCVRRNSLHSVQHLAGIACMSIAAKWPMKNELVSREADL
jgi:hypothetical protein